MSEQRSPIFIVGSSRSGTTMMNRILGNHPDISALNELHYLGLKWDPKKIENELPLSDAVIAAADLIRNIRRGIWAGMVTSEELSAARNVLDGVSPLTHQEVYRRILTAETECGTKFVTDQTPKNVFYVGAILAVFPDAKIVHMIRDPRAVLFSQRNRWKKRWLGADEMPIKNVLRVMSNYHPYTLTKLWNRSAQIARRYHGHSRYKVMRFETLVSQPENEIRELCDFLEIEFNDSMLDVPQVGSSNKRHDQSKVGISSDVVDSWRKGLPKGDIVVCESVASESMRVFGYPRVARLFWWTYSLFPLLRAPFHILGAIVFNPKIIAVQIKALVNSK